MEPGPCVGTAAQAHTRPGAVSPSPFLLTSSPVSLTPPGSPSPPVWLAVLAPSQLLPALWPGSLAGLLDDQTLAWLLVSLAGLPQPCKLSSWLQTLNGNPDAASGNIQTVALSSMVLIKIRFPCDLGSPALEHSGPFKVTTPGSCQPGVMTMWFIHLEHLTSGRECYK